jgi:1-deoxy-D-xylulose-5-phosphate reductoisomerase
MRLPIQYAMAHPRRLPAPAARLDLTTVGKLTFDTVDQKKYPCLALAYEAGRRGGTYPTVLNASNEEAVARFLAKDLGFTRIPELIEAALQAHTPHLLPTLDEVIEADAWARTFSRKYRR